MTQRTIGLRRVAQVFVICVFFLTLSSFVWAADFYIFSASMVPDTIYVGDTTNLSVELVAASSHNCQVAVSSDSEMEVLVPTRNFQFGGEHPGLFGEPEFNTYNLDFQIVAHGTGDHIVTVNYYVEGSLADSRQLIVHVPQYNMWTIGGIVLVVLVTGGLGGFLILVRKRIFGWVHGFTSGHEVNIEEVDDATLAKTAKQYGGVLTKTVIAYELSTSLDEAQNALDRYVKHGEARKIQIGEMSIYDIPSARIHLLGADKLIVELTIKNKGRISSTQLLRESGQSIEALNAALTRLERQGILVRNPNNTYRLAVVS